MPANHLGQDSPSSKIANTSAGRASSSTVFLKRMGAVSKNDASTGWHGKGMALAPRAAEPPLPIGFQRDLVSEHDDLATHLPDVLGTLEATTDGEATRATRAGQ